MWPSLKRECELAEEVKTAALELMSQPELMGRSPEVIVAACLYKAAQKGPAYLTQRELADKFGVTEVSIRNVKNLINHIQKRLPLRSSPERVMLGDIHPSVNLGGDV
jgi:transcription initiation factor TFIIIB Brf1 subunit/transcription initiation factor TFIIB